MSFMATWEGNDYWFSATGRSAIAYRVSYGIALTVTGPFGDPRRICGRSALRSPTFCARRSLDAGVLQRARTEQRAESVSKAGWDALDVGTEMVDRSRPHGRRAARNGRTCAPPSTKPSATASPTCSPLSRRRRSPCRRRSVRSPRSGPARRPCRKWASPWVASTSWSTPRVRTAVRGGRRTARCWASPAGCRPIVNGTDGRLDARLHAAPHRRRQRHHGIPDRPHGRTAARRRRTCEFMSLSAARAGRHGIRRRPRTGGERRAATTRCRWWPTSWNRLTDSTPCSASN